MHSVVWVIFGVFGSNEPGLTGTGHLGVVFVHGLHKLIRVA